MQSFQYYYVINQPLHPADCSIVQSWSDTTEACYQYIYYASNGQRFSAMEQRLYINNML